MSIRILSSRIEIAFWSVVVSLLSDSELVQGLVRTCYTGFTSMQYSRTVKQALLFCIAGLLTGIILGLAGL